MFQDSAQMPRERLSLYEHTRELKCIIIKYLPTATTKAEGPNEYMQDLTIRATHILLSSVLLPWQYIQVLACTCITNNMYCYVIYNVVTKRHTIIREFFVVKKFSFLRT